MYPPTREKGALGKVDETEGFGPTPEPFEDNEGAKLWVELLCPFIRGEELWRGDEFESRERSSSFVLDTEEIG